MLLMNALFFHVFSQVKCQLVYLSVALLLTISCFILSEPLQAQGFLEMPDTTVVPEFTEGSLLLDLDIPGVRERDPDPRAGPRLNVTEFRLQGIVEFPKLGITRAAIQKHVEKIRFELMREDLKTDFGDFTLDELGEIGSLLMEIEKDTLDEHVGPLEVQKLVFLVRDQVRRRGVTLGMIETVALTITQFYRERGFILAKAFIPKQKVRDGIVSITLLLGELGHVAVEGDKRVSTKLIGRAFKRDLNQPVTNTAIDETLYLVNDIPGLSAQGYFSVGQQVGDTLMTVKVQEEKWTTINFRLDNHGSKNTSEHRAYADIYVHNPLGIGDELQVAVLNSYNPDSSTYGSLRYSSMLYTPRLRGGIGFSTNDFVSRNILQSRNTFFSGESNVADVFIAYHLKRGRKKNFSFDLTYTDIDTILDTNSNVTQENAKKTSLGFSFDTLNEKLRQLYIGKVTLHKSDTFESGGFLGDVVDSDSFVTVDLSTLAFFTLPWTRYDTRFLIKNSLQYSGDSLSNLNQLNLTGPSRARGFAMNGFQVDDGVFIGIDWIFNFHRGLEKKIFGPTADRVLQPFLYLDGAYGYVNPVSQNDIKITGQLSNFGVGIRANFKGLNASFSWSQVLSDKIDTIDEPTEISGLYFEMQYSF